MTPDHLKSAGIKLYGRKKWQAHLADALAVDRSTIFRMLKRKQVPGPVEVAIKGMLENKKARDVLERQARKLLPRRVRIRRVPRAPKRKLIKAAGME